MKPHTVELQKMAITPLVKKDGTRVDGKEEIDSLDELKILLAKGKEIKCLIDGELCLVTVKPFEFDRLPQVLEVVSPMLEGLVKTLGNKNDFKKSLKNVNTIDMLKYVAQNKEQIYKFISVFEPDFTMETLRTLKADDLVEVVFAIVEVNIDFFIRRLSPAMLNSLNSLVTLLPKSISAYAKH